MRSSRAVRATAPPRSRPAPGPGRLRGPRSPSSGRHFPGPTGSPPRPRRPRGGPRASLGRSLAAGRLGSPAPAGGGSARSLPRRRPPPRGWRPRRVSGRAHQEGGDPTGRAHDLGVGLDAGPLGFGEGLPVGQGEPIRRKAAQWAGCAYFGRSLAAGRLGSPAPAGGGSARSFSRRRPPPRGWRPRRVSGRAHREGGGPVGRVHDLGAGLDAGPLGFGEGLPVGQGEPIRRKAAQ